MQPNQIEHYYFGTECKMDLGGGKMSVRFFMQRDLSDITL